MFEEDSLLDEQIRKKKRFVLLGLFVLLLIGTLAALSLITPTIPSSQLVAEAESKTPTPEQPASTPFNDAPSTPTPISTANVTLETTSQSVVTVSVGAKTPGAMAEVTGASAGTPINSKESPAAVQGDEWQEPGTPASSGVDDTTLETANPRATAITKSGNGSEESSTSSTPDGSEASETGIKTPTTPSEGTPPVGSITPTASAAEPNQITVTMTIAPDSSWDMPKGNSTATTDGDEPNGSPITSTATTESNTAPQENKPPALASNEPPDINELPRVHESWGPTGEDETLASVEASATAAPLTPTTDLTNTSIVSETGLVIPNGLPITGISLRHGLNWAAVAIVVLLLGAGITALRRPRSV